MNYALIENGIVTNLIWLHPMNADEFPNAVPTEDLPVAISDAYDGEKFYRDGVEVLNSTVEITEQNVIESILDEVSEVGY